MEPSDAAADGIGPLLPLFLLLPALAGVIFYLAALQKVLSRVAPERRRMAPVQVWLLLIPIFGFGWHFFITARVCASLKAEFEARGHAVTGDNYGRPVGLAMCAVSLANTLPPLGIILAFPSLLLWILWWRKVAGYSRTLAAVPWP